MKKYFCLLTALLAMSACAPQVPEPVDLSTQVDPVTGRPIAEVSNIESDPNRINLSDFSQEQQKRDREAYAEQFDNFAAQRLVATDVTVPETPTVNVAAYARATTNNVGEKLYQRNALGRSGCRNYTNSANAQRAFLENGGPTTDSLGLDRDGDGFACSFNPTPYRMLR